MAAGKRRQRDWNAGNGGRRAHPRRRAFGAHAANVGSGLIGGGDQARPAGDMKGCEAWLIHYPSDQGTAMEGQGRAGPG